MDEIRLKDMQILEFGTIILPQVVKNKKNILKKTIVKSYHQRRGICNRNLMHKLQREWDSEDPY